MIVKVFNNLKRFLFLMLVQIIVLNHVQWSGYVNPYIYILFIMLLPMETPKWAVLMMGFATGMTIDMFGNTAGLHAAASTLLAFARPGILNLIAPRDGYEPETTFTPQKLGLNWFLAYVIILTVIHHFFYFYLEVFRFSEFFYTFFKALVNSAISIVIIVIGIYLFGNQSKANERFAG
ncbi:rod shape-determining protein MreD [soil metagenome]